MTKLPVIRVNVQDEAFYKIQVRSSPAKMRSKRILTYVFFFFFFFFFFLVGEGVCVCVWGGGDIVN